MTGTSKRPADSSESAGLATPVKRLKAEGGASNSESDKAGPSGGVESSPAAGLDSTDSPLNGRGGRGGARGARGRGDSRGKGGRGGRGGDSRGRGGRGGGDRGGSDSRTWGGRSDNAKDGKKREWGGPKEGSPEADDKKERFPKKKVALLIGYNGLKYFGSQINPGTPTIEGEVWQALIKAGAVSADNATSHQKVGLSRAARTDAGVHAAFNVVSLKLIVEPPTLPADTTIEAYINSFLPPAVRIWSVLRVQGSFNPRALCDQRHYEYTIPTHVFLGPKPGTPMDAWLKKSRAQALVASVAATAVALESAATGAPLAPDAPKEAPLTETEISAASSIAESDKFWSEQPAGSSFSADLVAKRQWRISPGLLQSTREFFRAYEGSHNYYNYTVGKDFRDRSCQRVMRDLDVSDPFLVNDVEYVSVKFIGQSFMLHQIRKMIGLAILAIRSQTPPSLVPETFGPSRIHVPKAPALGLLLCEPQYIEYNKRVNEANKKLVDLRAAGRIDEKELVEQTRDHLSVAAVQAEVDAFKKAEIYTKMWQVEQEEAVFSKWLNYLDVYVGTDFEYLNPRGNIPATSVYRAGENPEKVRGQPGATSGEDAHPPSDDEKVGPGEEEG